MTVKYALETEVNTTGKGTGLEDVNGTVDRNLGNVVTEAIKESRRGFKTTSLTISGTDISLKIPGAPEYTGITTISVSYQEPMEVDLTGRIAEKQGRVEYLEIADARVAVTAYRTDKADAAISTALKVIAAAEEARKRDPEITLWQGTVRTVLNQVNGIPVIYVGKGEITYEKCSTHEKTSE